ncbi:MAG: hypothetical protein QXQ53_01710 [Candidatus Methanosuratincola sp.]
MTMCDVGHTRRARSVVESPTEVKGLVLLTGGHPDASRRTMGQKRWGWKTYIKNKPEAGCRRRMAALIREEVRAPCPEAMNMDANARLARHLFSGEGDEYDMSTLWGIAPGGGSVLPRHRTTPDFESILCSAWPCEFGRGRCPTRCSRGGQKTALHGTGFEFDLTR